MNKKATRLMLLLAAGMVLSACQPISPVEPSSNSGNTSSNVPPSSSSDGGAASSSDGGGAISSSDGGGAISSSDGGGEPVGKVASGPREFVTASYDDRTKILGQLEKYAIDHALTGLPLYQTGGYVMYQNRVTKGTNTYVPNYGFSILRDGSLSGNLEGETVAEYQSYYHTWNSSDPKSLNALDADGSQIADLYSEQSSGYFGNRLTADKTGFEWYGVLSKFDRPLAVENGVVKEIADTLPEELHQTWRVYVRTGADSGVMYRTASTAAGRAAYNNRPVALEDYLTPFKYMLNQANGVYRGAELAKQTGKSGFVGASSYFQQTKNAAKGIAEISWDNVGIQTGNDAKGDYLEFTFLLPTNRFYAMYATASDLYMPIPADFFDTIGGVDNYGNSSEDKTTSMLDNMLSVGPYYMASYEPDQLFTFKRNDNWWEHAENPNVYKIEGIHERVLSAYETDKNVGVKAFLANELDAATLTDDYLEDYQDDPRTTKVPGTSVFKLNVNSCDAATWEELFGENGTITTTAKANYWDCKPWMANENFVKGLFYSIDRKTYADARGSYATVNYFSDAYQSNPEEGISYNSTPEHAAALADFWGDTVDTYGYDFDLATAAFEEAIKELIASGALKADSPDLTIDVEWMYQYQIKDEGEELAGYMEAAFNAAAEELGYDFQLKVINNYDGSSYVDVYYNHLMVGQFDLGFGSISGNTLDPLNFMEVLKSDNSSGFTLNWGSDTSAIDFGPNGLVWDDEYYSFNGLWDAADHGALLDENGQTIPWLGFEAASAVASADGLVTISGTLGLATAEGLEIDVQNICGMMTTDYSDYYEVYPDLTGDGPNDSPSAVTKFEVKDGTVEFEFTLGETDSATAITNGAVFLSSDANIYLNGVYLGMNSAAWTGVRVDTSALPAPTLQLSGRGFDNISNEVIR